MEMPTGAGAPRGDAGSNQPAWVDRLGHFHLDLLSEQFFVVWNFDRENTSLVFAPAKGLHVSPPRHFTQCGMEEQLGYGVEFLIFSVI